MIFDFNFFIQIAHATTEAAAEAPKGGIGSLGLNLKLFIAQLVNFGIVLFVLWKWVFAPVAKKLTERTEKIEKSIRDASDVEKQKEEFSVWKENEMSKTRNQATAIITESEVQAIKIKEQTLLQTKEENDKIIKQAKDQIEQEKQKAVSEAKSQLADLITIATEKIIKQKLSDKGDKELIKNSLQDIN